MFYVRGNARFWNIDKQLNYGFIMFMILCYGIFLVLIIEKQDLCYWNKSEVAFYNFWTPAQQNKQQEIWGIVLQNMYWTSDHLFANHVLTPS